MAPNLWLLFSARHEINKVFVGLHRVLWAPVLCWDYDRRWYMASFLWFIWSVRMMEMVEITVPKML